MNIRTIFPLVIATASLITTYAQRSPIATPAVFPAATPALSASAAPSLKPLRILAFDNLGEDANHVAFAESAISFFSGLNGSRELKFEATADPSAMK